MWWVADGRWRLHSMCVPAGLPGALMQTGLPRIIAIVLLRLLPDSFQRIHQKAGSRSHMWDVIAQKDAMGDASTSWYPYRTFRRISKDYAHRRCMNHPGKFKDLSEFVGKGLEAHET